MLVSYIRSRESRAITASVIRSQRAPRNWNASGVAESIFSLVASALALLITLAGAWCGGEMVYGRGVVVQDPSSDT